MGLAGRSRRDLFFSHALHSPRVKDARLVILLPVDRVGIRLGSEDPQIWDVLEMKGRPSVAALKALGQIKSSDTITNVGRGEIVTVDATRDDGARTVTLGESGMLRASYTSFATYPILYHQGAGGYHEAAITFDDGPDPEWTPKILDILRERGVKAAFFVVGKTARTIPDSSSASCRCGSRRRSSATPSCWKKSTRKIGRNRGRRRSSSASRINAATATSSCFTTPAETATRRSPLCRKSSTTCRPAEIASCRFPNYCASPATN